MNRLRKLVAALLLGLGSTAGAYTITAELTGDGRSENPDNLNIDVMISVTGKVATWTVDLDMAASHPSAKLDEFYFNMVGVATDYSFTGFSPSTWSVISPASEVGGINAASFLFESSSSSPRTDVTNSVPLTFTMTYLGTGDLLAAYFLTADTETGAAGSGQLAAHIQALTSGGANGGTTDSGIAVGNYISSTSTSSTSTGSGTSTTSSGIPEPGTLTLLGIGMLGGLFAYRRRRQMAA